MLPEKFKERMRAYLSEKEYEEFISSFDTDERYQALRINELKSDVLSAKEMLSYLGNNVPWEKTAFYYNEDPANMVTPGKHPYHEAGLYYIQEPSAMSPVCFLDPKPGDKVLDLCAAPGGKTTQIASKMKGQGILITNEINRDRARILSLNVERMGISNALVTNEDSAKLASVFEGYFDKILVDAPCSGEGMFRKNDNAADEWSMENVKTCALRQEEILDNAAKMLLPGGRLVYSTCTFAADENEESILKFLCAHPDFHVVKVDAFEGMDPGRAELISPELRATLEAKDKALFEKSLEQIQYSIRLWPHKLKGEGHFLCVLERDGELLKDSSFVPGGRNIPAKPECIKPFETFVMESLKFDKKTFELKRGNIYCRLESGQELKGIIFMFGDQMYLAPGDMPSVMGLKCMRPGLHLGTLKKDRFEPSHALALFLKKEDVNIAFDHDADSDDIKAYLNGQTIRAELSGQKGWALVTVSGLSIGWAKAAGGMLKNHYPKGLRINYA